MPKKDEQTHEVGDSGLRVLSSSQPIFFCCDTFHKPVVHGSKLWYDGKRECNPMNEEYRRLAGEAYDSEDL